MISAIVDGVKVEGNLTFRESHEIRVRLVSPYLSFENAAYIPKVGMASLSYRPERTFLSEYGDEQAHLLLIGLYRIYKYMEDHTQFLKERVADLDKTLADAEEKRKELLSQRRALREDVKGGKIDARQYREQVAAISEAIRDLPSTHSAQYAFFQCFPAAVTINWNEIIDLIRSGTRVVLIKRLIDGVEVEGEVLVRTAKDLRIRYKDQEQHDHLPRNMMHAMYCARHPEHNFLNDDFFDPIATTMLTDLYRSTISRDKQARFLEEHKALLALKEQEVAVEQAHVAELLKPWREKRIALRKRLRNGEIAIEAYREEMTAINKQIQLYKEESRSLSGRALREIMKNYRE